MNETTNYIEKKYTNDGVLKKTSEEVKYQKEKIVDGIWRSYDHILLEIISQMMRLCFSFLKTSCFEN